MDIRSQTRTHTRLCRHQPRLFAISRRLENECRGHGFLPNSPKIAQVIVVTMDADYDFCGVDGANMLGASVVSIFVIVAVDFLTNLLFCVPLRCHTSHPVAPGF